MDSAVHEQDTSIAPSQSVDGITTKSHLPAKRRSPRQRKKLITHGKGGEEMEEVTLTDTTKRHRVSNTKSQNDNQRNRRQKNQRKQRHTSDPDTDSSCDFTTNTTNGSRDYTKSRVTYVKDFTAGEIVYEDNDREIDYYSDYETKENEDGEYEEYDEEYYDDEEEDDDYENEEEQEEEDYFGDSALGERKRSNTSSTEGGSLTHRSKRDKRIKRKSKIRQFSTQRTYSNESNEGGSGRIISKGQMRGRIQYY